MGSRKNIFLYLILLLYVPGVLVAAPVEIYGVDVRSWVSEGSFYGAEHDEETYTDTSIPASEVITAQVGSIRSTTVVDFRTVGNSNIFDFDLDHVRGSSSGSNADTIATIEFKATKDMTYRIEGNYSLSGNLKIYLDVYIFNRTDGDFLFRNYQLSENTTNESFTLGSSSGDNGNLLEGNLTGNLIGGRVYEIYLRAIIQVIGGDSDSGASATGGVTFTIENPVLVPPVLLLLDD
jgi:hypothetical protein